MTIKLDNLTTLEMIQLVAAAPTRKDVIKLLNDYHNDVLSYTVVVQDKKTS